MRGTGEVPARTNQLQRHLRQHENRPQPLRLVHEHVRINGDPHLSGAIIADVFTQLVNHVTALEQQVVQLQRHQIGGG
jgi:hypothetical protein